MSEKILMIVHNLPSVSTACPRGIKFPISRLPVCADQHGES